MSSLSRLNMPEQRPLSTYAIKLNIAPWLFWMIFLLSCFLTRILDVALLGLFRTGAVVLLSSAMFVVYRFKLVNRTLLFIVTVFGALIALSAIVNHRGLIQFIAFFRIPVTAYLIYFVAYSYLKNKARVEKVLRLMYVVGCIQLPVLVVQRLAYPFLPDRLITGAGLALLSSDDFGTGTFQGDGAMTFFLLTLLILLLFWNQVTSIVKRKWLLAFWFSVTVLAGNSQIQHITLALIWVVFLVFRFNPKIFIGVTALFMIVFFVLGWLWQTGILTFTPIEHTVERIGAVVRSVTSPVFRQMQIERFLAGGHARAGATYYFLSQPIKWIGDGPGIYYNTVTRERTLGTWGHVYTFYAEVGLIGLVLSMLLFFIMAFPLTTYQTKIRLQIGMVPMMVFIAMTILSLAKYPMNNTPMIFTYSVILIGYRVLSSPKYLSLGSTRRGDEA